MRSTGPRHRKRRGERRIAPAALAFVAIVGMAGCTAAIATPSAASDGGRRTLPVVIVSLPEASAAWTPGLCQDGPNAPKLRPTDCVTPTDRLAPRVPGANPAASPSPAQTLPSNLSTLPPVVAWHGKTFYTPPSGEYVQLVGVGPDDTVYALLERALPGLQPTPTDPVIPNVAASLIALLPDGSSKPGWPRDGVPVASLPMSFRVSPTGTVFIASLPMTPVSSGNMLSQITITAIADGAVLPGWPYRTPPALQYFDPNLLALGPDDSVCFTQVEAGLIPSGSNTPHELYCVGKNGELLPGWPYSSPMPLMDLAVGPNGTAYVAQVTSTEFVKTEPSPYAFPFQILAIGRDGKPFSGWVPWLRADGQGLTRILPTSDGRVVALLGGEDGKAQVVVLDGSGKAIVDHPEQVGTLSYPNYKDEVLLDDGTLFVGVDDKFSCVNAYASDGSQLSGWPQLVGGWPDIAVSAKGPVWVDWTDYGSDGNHETSVVALFDRDGRLQPGYPMASQYLSTLTNGPGLEVDSHGNAYGTAETTTSSTIAVMTP